MKKLIHATVLLALLSTGCSGLFFYPDRIIRDNPVALSFVPQDVYFKTSDGLTLHGWYFRAAQKGSATVLVLHGNAQNLSTHVNGVLWLVKAGFNLFIFDYRGYGRSEGTTTLDGVHRDAEAALDELLTLPGVDGTQVVVLGQSVGGAIAVYETAQSGFKRHVRALIVESAFSGYRDIAREKLSDIILTWPLQYPLSYLVNDRYSPIRWIARVSPVPMLIIHGEQDPVVPFHHGRELYAAARQPKAFLETTTPGHVMSFADAGVRDAVAQFIREHTAEKQP